MDHFDIIWIACFIFLGAGTIKGLVGVGLPTASISLLSQLVDPRTAIELTLVPMTAVNLWQLLSAGKVPTTIRRYWPFSVLIALGVGTTSFATQNTPSEHLTIALAVVILVYVMVSWRNLIPPVPTQKDLLVQICFGVVTGVVGGLTGVWGPPVIAYLTAQRLEKDEFIGASAFLIFCGCLPLVYSYVRIGFADTGILKTSALMLIPALAGFKLGEKIRKRLSGEAFRKAVLLTFALLALALLRKSFM